LLLPLAQILAASASVAAFLTPDVANVLCWIFTLAPLKSETTGSVGKHALNETAAIGQIIHFISDIPLGYAGMAQLQLHV
jgi:hypothetical protein